MVEGELDFCNVEVFYEIKILSLLSNISRIKFKYFHWFAKPSN